MAKTGETWEYTYNAAGIRTKRVRTVGENETTWEYIYSGSQLAQMTKGTDTLTFTYDANGTPTALTHNGTIYYYVTNLQGDIIAILNGNGVAVAEYTYDAWGNPMGTVPATGIGEMNPLRYRGYVYDTETGLYYLQSRYYNPQIGRFFNADSQLSISLGILGSNMFSYCLNNSINMLDYSGNKPGDLFDTMDEAARDAVIYLGALSWESGWEYATAIYSVKTTVTTYETVTRTHRFLWWTWTTTSRKAIKSTKLQYTYKAVVTDKAVDSVTIPQAPLFKERVATLHTHPMGSWLGITRFSEGDIENAIARGIPSYVHGPNGKLMKYDPATGEDIVVFSDLPISQNKPWLD